MFATVLQFIGAAVVGFAGLLAVLYGAVYLWAQFSYGRRGLQLLAGAPLVTPARITLRRDTSPCLYHPEAVRDRAMTLRSVGFVPVNYYTIDQLEDIGLMGLYHPGLRLLAVIWDHPTLPARFEVAAHYPGRHFFKISNHPVHRDEPAPPGSTILFQDAPDVGAALAALETVAPREGRVPIDDRNLVARFEYAYARTMDGLIKQDRLSDEFIRANVAAWGIDRALCEDDIADIRRYYRRSLAGQLEIACIGNFLRSGAVDAARWERLRKRVIVVHDRMTRQHVLDSFARCLPESMLATLHGRIEAAQNVEGIALFEHINASLPAPHRFKRLGSVAEPVPAAICAPP